MREILPPNRISGKPFVLLLRAVEGPFVQRRPAPNRLTDMARFARFWVVLLAAAPALAQAPPADFQGQVGRLDELLLGEDWYTLSPAEMPSIPLAGVTVRVLECEEDCPAPVQTDAAGWFTFTGLGMDSALLSFTPPPCAEDDSECEPLEPRQEVLANGARTVLGAKWPAGIEDTMLRYMPLVAAAIYIKREGEIPGKNNTAGSASQWAVWVNGALGWGEFSERSTFLHELMHHYEFRLRLACWYENQDIDGFILHESWLRAYESDRLHRELNGLPLRERSLSHFSDKRQAQESLADFAEHYFMPEALSHGQRSRPGVQEQVTGYREIEQYAPNRYVYFEQLVFQPYIDEKRWRRKYPDGGEWPGMCRPPILDQPAGILESITKSSSAPGYKPLDPPVIGCASPASH